MTYTYEEIKEFIEEEDVKFIRLMFRDAYGVQKNLSIMPSELEKAFTDGVRVNARQIAGFTLGGHDHLYLRPDPSTIAILPWRPESGRVIRLFCDLYLSEDTPCDSDTRVLLEQAVDKAKKAGIGFKFGSQSEFYLFRLDDEGGRTDIPHDEAGYMDIAPLDRGENIRREICLTIEEMGLRPERSHHEAGPGQNEIDFHYGDPLTAADHMSTFTMAVSTIAGRNGLYADFSPMPIKGKPGNGYHINIYASTADGTDVGRYAAAGILDKIRDITLFLNPTEASYRRFGSHSAPDRVNWLDFSAESQDINGSNTASDHTHTSTPGTRDTSACHNSLLQVYPYKGMIRTELRSPDAMSNPYLAYAILIEAGLRGIRERMELPEAVMDKGDLLLPQSLTEAIDVASGSEFVREAIPERIRDIYLNQLSS